MPVQVALPIPFITEYILFPSFIGGCGNVERCWDVSVLVRMMIVALQLLRARRTEDEQEA